MGSDWCAEERSSGGPTTTKPDVQVVDASDWCDEFLTPTWVAALSPGLFRGMIR